MDAHTGDITRLGTELDHARTRRAAKRPDSHQKVVLEEALEVTDKYPDNIIDIDRAQSRLAFIDVCYFGGPTAEETAEVSEISLNTVKQDWSVEKAWLHGELTRELPVQ